MTFLFINRDNQIGVEGSKGLGDGIITLVHLTSLQLDLSANIYRYFSLRSLSIWTNINDNFIILKVIIIKSEA
jgi:hypothetical protein